MSTLFDVVFQVEDVDGGRYRNVSRIEGKSNDCKITVDINTELFSVNKNDTLTLALASTLNNEDTTNTQIQGQATQSWRPPVPGERNLSDDYDYCMYGVAYKFEEVDQNNIAVYYSFGGLLMRLEGNPRNLSNLKQDNAYLLIRR
ncbi:DNA-directed RNA polymerases I, II, and III subunit RPABC3 [Hanseniaspora osmophila]|mgnify:CR=1 FL=1|uniref:DNA-directed RNA polymerases I, II, and III subunit RPABC3 n=1 Tax=Hanseniaspora osmophila TaxID=56408 RepID=A0A1E5R7X5_9ASCO|nr:DNA-directed RNA polymerases I, II, and III subunit RPABC3 [Hanseniaspora osmophila]